LEGGISIYDSYAIVGPETITVSLPNPSAPKVDTEWDYIHVRNDLLQLPHLALTCLQVNSVDKDVLGNYLMSGRHTCAVYYISGTTGEILWILGGKNSTFTGGGTNFCFQHNPRFADETGLTADAVSALTTRNITLFDNENGITTEPARPKTVSRGLKIALDLETNTTSIVTTFASPGSSNITSVQMGNVQLLAPVSALNSTNVVVGYGLESNPTFNAAGNLTSLGFKSYFAEYAVSGSPLRLVQYVGAFAAEVSYRVYKNDWVGTPSTDPDVAISAGVLYVSWNGATEVVSWQVVSWQVEQSTDGVSFDNSTVVPRSGFETAISIATAASTRVSGLAANGTLLGTSSTLGST
jgi:hypothetical protein